jgi:hypothetical protein
MTPGPELQPLSPCAAYWAKEIHMISTVTKSSPEITRAAERYMEQYGDPLVMNS